MRDWVDIGATPCEEDCQSVPYQDSALARRECLAFIEAIRKAHGHEPTGARLAIKSNPHDFGTYYEVVCYFNDEHEAAVEYAFKCENDAPRTWAEVGMTAPTASDLVTR